MKYFQWNFQSLKYHEGMFNDCYNEHIPDWVVLDAKTQKFKDSLTLKYKKILELIKK